MTPQGRSLLTSFVLLVAASGAGLYAYYGVKRPEEAAEARKASDEALFKPHATSTPGTDGTGEAGAARPSVEAAFTELTIEGKGERARLEKRGESWFLVEPLEAKAEAFTVDAILAQLRTGKIKREITPTPSEEELVRFGLKPPRFSVTAKAYFPDATGGGKDDSARARSLSLRGGIENSFDGSVYVQRDDDPKVYAAEGALRQALDKSVFDLRDKEVLSFDEKSVRRLTVKMGPRSLSLEQEGAKGWKMGSEAADNATVTGMLSSFKGQRALSFPAPTPALEKMFSRPSSEVGLTLAEGAPLTFRFASSRSDGKLFVLRQQGESRIIAEMPAEAVKPLDRDPKELKDRSVTGIKAAEVARIAFKPAGSDPAAVVERTALDGGMGEHWSVIAPEKQPAEDLKLSSALWSLESLKASTVLEDRVTDPSKYGFGPAAQSISLYGLDGRLLARVELGKEVPKRPEHRYVRGARGQVLEVDSEKLNALPRGLADLIPSPAADAGSTAH